MQCPMISVAFDKYDKAIGVGVVGQQIDQICGNGATMWCPQTSILTEPPGFEVMRSEMA